MNISFYLTQKQILAQTKTVTRRLGWIWLVETLKKGPVILQPVVKGQGIPKGGRVEKLGPPIKVSDARLEPLNAITYEDVVADGFPHLGTDGFVRMFCEHNGCEPETVVTRIKFSYTTQTELDYENENRRAQSWRNKR